YYEHVANLALLQCLERSLSGAAGVRATTDFAALRVDADHLASRSRFGGQGAARLAQARKRLREQLAAFVDLGHGRMPAARVRLAFALEYRPGPSRSRTGRIPLLLEEHVNLDCVWVGASALHPSVMCLPVYRNHRRDTAES